MGIVASLGIALLVFTTVIHYEVLGMLSAGLPALRIPGRAKLVVIIFSAFIAHIVEIFLYAVAFHVLVQYFGVGALGQASDASLTLCFYFSAETYTSLGYGDVVPSGDLRLLAGMEALNGLLLIGWSASYTFIAMERFWKDNGHSKR